MRVRPPSLLVSPALRAVKTMVRGPVRLPRAAYSPRLRAVPKLCRRDHRRAGRPPFAPRGEPPPIERPTRNARIRGRSRHASAERRRRTRIWRGGGQTPSGGSPLLLSRRRHSGRQPCGFWIRRRAAVTGRVPPICAASGYALGAILDRAFSLLKAIWGQEMQHITDRLTEAFACGLVRDVDGPNASQGVGRGAVFDGESPYAAGAFVQMPPGYRPPCEAAAGLGYQPSGQHVAADGWRRLCAVARSTISS